MTGLLAQQRDDLLHPIDGISIRSDILDLQSDEIAASQLAVDGKIEYRQITRPLLNLEFGPDSPDMLLP
jgi:hypothetical protein